MKYKINDRLTYVSPYVDDPDDMFGTYTITGVTPDYYILVKDGANPVDVVGWSIKLVEDPEFFKKEQ